MTSKTFDNHGSTRKLHIESVSEGFVLLKIGFGRHEEFFTVSSDSIPPISLALLEAAGWPECEPTSITHTILSDLNRVVELQERITAEAKDKAKLEAEALELINASNEAIGVSPYSSMDVVSEVVMRRWLAVARKSRELGGRAEK